MRTVCISGLTLCALLGAATPTQAQTACGQTTWNLTAGQTIDVGSVMVSNDLTNIYVKFTLDYQDTNCPEGPVDAKFGTLHLWIGNDLLNVPANSQGTPVPGQFPYHAQPTETTYTFTIPFEDLGITGVNDANDLCNTTLYVFTHAEVVILDCNGDNVANETAWGGDQPGTGPRWYFYGAYRVCCDFGPPPVDFCQTAYAKGGYIWTTQKRSNPENLPSLKLSMNRWGWAIKLTAIGETSYQIWAGAGLNDTANGVLVGTLYVDWNGTNVEFFYDLADGYVMKEIHVYAGDEAPTTIAPGQYGYIEYFNPPVNSFGDTLPLVDSNANGVWVVAHAVVCTVRN